jgi:hypothetical protein
VGVVVVVVVIILITVIATAAGAIIIVVARWTARVAVGARIRTIIRGGGMSLLQLDSATTKN